MRMNRLRRSALRTSDFYSYTFRTRLLNLPQVGDYC